MPATMMPVRLLSSPVLTAGSIATTIRFMSYAAALGGNRAASMRSRVHKAPGVSSSSSASSSSTAQARSSVLPLHLVHVDPRQIVGVIDCPAAGQSQVPALSFQQLL